MPARSNDGCWNGFEALLKTSRPTLDILGRALVGPVAALLAHHLPRIEASYGGPVVWELSKKLPEGFHSQYVLRSRTQPVILLRAIKRDDIFNVVVAHELMHLVLNIDGFPRAQSGAGVDPRLGLVVYNTFVDPIVYRRLTSEGVSSEPLERLQFANTIQGLFERSVHEPTPLDEANAGLWTCTFVAMLLKDGLGLSNEFERVLNGRYSSTLKRAVQLVHEVRDIGLENPDGCARAMERALERTKLQRLVLIEQGMPAPGE